MATDIQPSPGALREEGEGGRRGRRRRQFIGLAAGAVLGWLVGFGIEYFVGTRLITGSASDPFSISFGLPSALAIACGLFGLMLGTSRDVEVVDAPVRIARFRRLGRAATSERGQLRGSPVAPRGPSDRSGE